MRNVFRHLSSGRKARGGHKPHLLVEYLDDRTVPSTFSISGLGKRGSGSLRQASLNASSPADPDADIIKVACGLVGTMGLAGALPDLSTNIDIQGPVGKLPTADGGRPARHRGLFLLVIVYCAKKRVNGIG
jgi:hypothetical protein